MPMNALLDKLSKFLGYGSNEPKVIFVGIEEKANDGDEGSYRQRLKIQSELNEFEDLGGLCEQLTKAYLYNPQNLRPQPTWAPLCFVMLGINGMVDQMGQDSAIIEYQRTNLGKIHGDNLLAELLPVPKSGTSIYNDVHCRLLDIIAKETIRDWRTRSSNRSLLHS